LSIIEQNTAQFLVKSERRAKKIIYLKFCRTDASTCNQAMPRLDRPLFRQMKDGDALEMPERQEGVHHAAGIRRPTSHKHGSARHGSAAPRASLVFV
jgi:hypothetical protein